MAFTQAFKVLTLGDINIRKYSIFYLLCGNFKHGRPKFNVGVVTFKVYNKYSSLCAWNAENVSSKNWKIQNCWESVWEVTHSAGSVRPAVASKDKAMAVPITHHGKGWVVKRNYLCQILW